MIYFQAQKFNFLLGFEDRPEFWVYGSNLTENLRSGDKILKTKHLYNSSVSKTATISSNRIEYTKYPERYVWTRFSGDIVRETIEVLNDNFKIKSFSIKCLLTSLI